MPQLFSHRPLRPVLLAVFALLLFVPQAQAAFPGRNGKIVFASQRGGGQQNQGDLHTMNADGSAVTNITNTGEVSEYAPAWSPDGTKIAFTAGNHIHTMNADGSGVVRLTNNLTHDIQPAWSPDGTRIAFASTDPTIGEIYTINPDGTGPTNITSNPGDDQFPAWSPDGTKIVFMRDGTIHTMNRDGSAATSLTSVGTKPAWSPDGTRIAFQRFNCCVNYSEIYVMNTDGTGQTDITNNVAQDYQPDWQPLPAYPRPKSATPLRVSLVPAYTACTAPNHVHGPPLAFNSCSPPAQASSYLTVGTVDANGAAEQSVGTVKVKAIPGSPSTPADESDARIETSIIDVRRKTGLADYTGELATVLRVRLTDRSSGGAQTVQDFPLDVTVPCTATADPAIGSDCSLITTADTVLPGAVPESKRSIWAIDKVDVFDGGPDEVGSTSAGNTLFATQGVFVP